MKRVVSFAAISLLLLAGAANAQSGITGGQDGLHQHNANTLGQWNFSFGFGSDVSIDAWSLARGAQVYDENGKSIGLYEMDGSVSGNINVALGLFNWLDIGANLPLYYEYVGTTTGLGDSLGMNGMGRGDVETWMKIRLPIGNDSSVFSTALFVQGFFPTGEEGVGLRPRHTWYLSDDYVAPFTANSIALAVNGIFTFDFSKRGIPLRWNSQVGFLYVFDDDRSNVLLYSTGFNWLAHRKLDVFLEFSGEMRLQEDPFPTDPLSDPMIITPGLRFHVTKNVDFGMGLEVAVRTFKNFSYKGKEEMKDADRYVLTYSSEHGRKATYSYAPSPLFAGAMTLVYRFGGSDETNTDSLIAAKVDSILDARKAAREAAINDSLSKLDTDKDGINDAIDKCNNTPANFSVDSTGCPIDGDKDGIPDGLDKCPSTKPNTAVDTNGCESDFDKDGVPDTQDKCPNTPAGVGVDSTGCAIDTDNDGVSNTLDKCPNTTAGITVDSTGCPLDFDKDGVFDINDKCPNTKPGEQVDSTGCSLDSDKDGVTDGFDKCPNTEAKVSVDSIGCPLDFDKDGVPDNKDKCPNTLPGVKIDTKGCPLNKKQDLDQLKKGIQFKLNSAKLTKSSYGTLDDIAKLMKQIPEANLEVQGHTDELGSSKTNQKLSEKRAQTVVDYLEKKGVESNRLRAVGFGSSKPISSNKSRHGRKQNRRVELVPFTTEQSQQ